jgi:uncharacterized membrane protein YkvA (DUF1232 family)
MTEEKRNWLGPYIPQGSWIRDIAQQLKLTMALMMDPRVHPLLKLVPVAALAYLISPVDLIMGVPGLSAVDDITVVLLGLRFFNEMAPPEVVREHLKRLAGTIAGDWRVVDDPGAPPAPAAGPVVDGTIIEKKDE